MCCICIKKFSHSGFSWPNWSFFIIWENTNWKPVIILLIQFSSITYSLSFWSWEILHVCYVVLWSAVVLCQTSFSLLRPFFLSPQCVCSNFVCKTKVSKVKKQANTWQCLVAMSTEIMNVQVFIRKSSTSIGVVINATETESRTNFTMNVLYFIGVDRCYFIEIHFEYILALKNKKVWKECLVADINYSLTNDIFSLDVKKWSLAPAAASPGLIPFHGILGLGWLKCIKLE